MISIEDDLKDFGYATFLLFLINYDKDEYFIDINPDSRHIKKDFIDYINHLTIELADRNRLFSRAFHTYLNKDRKFTPKIVLEFFLNLQKNYIDVFSKNYNLLHSEYKELKKIKVNKSNEVDVIEKIISFNEAIVDINITYSEYKEGFIDYVINFLELLELKYYPNIEEIITLNQHQIDFLENTRNYIDGIFKNYHRLEVTFSELQRDN